MQYTNQQVCSHDVLSSQGNVAFKSPWGAWSFPAVCRMGAPRPAAGKKPVPLGLHSLSSSSQVEICQYQSALTEEAQQWLVTVAQPNLVVIRFMHSVMTTFRSLRWTSFALTSINVSQEDLCFVTAREAVRDTVADGILVAQPLAWAVWGCWERSSRHTAMMCVHVPVFILDHSMVRICWLSGTSSNVWGCRTGDKPQGYGNEQRVALHQCRHKGQQARVSTRVGLWCQPRLGAAHVQGSRCLETVCMIMETNS